ncbi:diphosphomevalonate decarboxylase [Thiomicrorhabdus sp. Milos-T2]|uniref:diphosphomevalonate decarboxylase n=1 Tax=Thiomicrorhabdus sp. Milos-T2 TaxID=90814 RepID=UPI000493EC84|nr:diphosphomevalonate decarboxylase [Thiomicrorhabdus sp. Milos-T2]
MSQAIQQKFVHQVIGHSSEQNRLATTKKLGKGKAPVNIALSKYWGKRDSVLNLPTNSSLSISLPGLGTETKIEVLNPQTTQEDQVYLNGQPLEASNAFANRVSRFLNFFRATPQTFFKVTTVNSVPTAAGLASSASGYAALVLALNDLFSWNLDNKALSLLARFGSGSASRSLFSGFAIWHQGQQADGLDSYAEAIETTWPEFCVGLLEIDVKQKPVSSTQGMQNTVETCALYQAWPKQANQDLQTLLKAIELKDFETLGKTAEHNALTMHATMIATWPPIVYWQPESVEAMHKIWHLREQGVQVYFTMDAGPNLKLLFLETEKPAIKQAFKAIKVLEPFKD